MATVSFKAKPETIHNADGSVSFQRVKVPALSRKHCDMAAFRDHPKLGVYANSDLFDSALRRSLTPLGIGAYIRLDRIPPGVAIDASGFLASVTIDIS